MMAKQPLAEIAELLDYCPLTGSLIWKSRGDHLFRECVQGRANRAAIWNAKHAGKVAGWVTVHGYISVKIMGKYYSGHQLAWALHFGEWYVGGIDHDNGNKADNRIGNLRKATAAENNKNAAIRSDNTSGSVGVYARKSGGWIAQIKSPTGNKHLGVFKTKDDAIAARLAAQMENGYHANHGRTPVIHCR